MFRRATLVVVMPVVLAVFGLLPATAAAQDDFSCRASAARVVTTAPLPALTVEPIVANGPASPCATDTAQVLSPTTVGPVTAAALFAGTNVTPGQEARSLASVANAAVATGPATGITASILSAAAGYQCVDGQPRPTSSSQVVGLTINGTPITVPDGPLTIDLGPIGMLHLNQTVTEANRVTQRAFFLDTPLADVVIAEAIAGFNGNACAQATAPVTAPAPGSGVQGERQAPARAALTTVPSSVRRTVATYGTTRCIGRSFLAVVTGRNIARVTFALDGRRLTVDRSARFEVRIRGAAGIHRVTARVVFRSATNAAPRTLSFRFKRCAPAVQFTG